ncbi:IS66 family transposase [Rhodoblastus acidophilus]|uniref:IS66 family transposase n=1 Tax=Rhodoblastus acidophilus TaxID=1074 RepID=A0A6N8DKS0_RHOAC|nr:hypothetical protein [Rhodoblastus acidophilus]MTV29841.1 IS66 family transposase [Rhodoblastus acidophilus]
MVTLDPILIALKAHVLRGARIHADDTTVPVLAKGKTATGRLWTYVRDDRPFGGKDPPAAFFEYSRNRAGEHPQQHLAGWSGIMQADAYNGYNPLYEAARKPAPIREAACWAHWRRKLFDHAKTGKAPIAVEAVRRMDQIFACERTVTGKPPHERIAVRKETIAPLVEDLRVWLTEQRAKLSAKTDLAKDINYGLSRWVEFTRFLDFWKALEEAFPTTRHQRCWFHKSGNVLNKLPKSFQPAAHQDLREIWLSPSRAKAEAAMETFAEKYAPKYNDAVKCLLKDRDALLAFFDFPAEHWAHLRTTNPIESVFSTVRHRTIRTKGALSPDTARLMVFKLVTAASKNWRRLQGQNQLPKIISGVKFCDGIEAASETKSAA